jgi:predicted transcriptional regulator
MEIVFDVLRAMGSGYTVPTHIMYASNVTWGKLHCVLDHLVEQGYVEHYKEQQHNRYRLSDQGREALAQSMALVDVLGV